jgi:fumarate hydratase class II
MQEINQRLIPSLKDLHVLLREKATQFGAIKKIGRTHLQDAVPMFLGQEFSGYARQVELGLERIADAQGRLLELALGGTAVGSGLNAHPDFASAVIRGIEAHTHIHFREASNHFEAQAARDAVVETSGILKVVALSLMKIANDIRWLGSGPRCGIGEINIPALQPGSSIMPGKVNPVIPEAVLQVGMQVIGNDTTIMLGAQGGNFELNVAMPVMTYNLLQSIEILGNAAGVLATKCVAGITPNREKCEAYVQKSLALVTSLVPHIGYAKAAALAQKAYDTGRNIKDIAMEEKILPESELDKLLP